MPCVEIIFFNHPCPGTLFSLAVSLFTKCIRQEVLSGDTASYDKEGMCFVVQTFEWMRQYVCSVNMCKTNFLNNFFLPLSKFAGGHVNHVQNMNTGRVETFTSATVWSCQLKYYACRHWPWKPSISSFKYLRKMHKQLISWSASAASHISEISCRHRPWNPSILSFKYLRKVHQQSTCVCDASKMFKLREIATIPLKGIDRLGFASRPIFSLSSFNHLVWPW